MSRRFGDISAENDVETEITRHNPVGYIVEHWMRLADRAVPGALSLSRGGAGGRAKGSGLWVVTA
jgi:hypothetical protein